MIHPKYENIWYAREANGVSDVGYASNYKIHKRYRKHKTQKTNSICYLCSPLML